MLTLLALNFARKKKKYWTWGWSSKKSRWGQHEVLESPIWGLKLCMKSMFMTKNMPPSNVFRISSRTRADFCGNFKRSLELKMPFLVLWNVGCLFYLVSLYVHVDTYRTSSTFVLKQLKSRITPKISKLIRAKNGISVYNHWISIFCFYLWLFCRRYACVLASPWMCRKNLMKLKKLSSKSIELPSTANLTKGQAILRNCSSHGMRKLIVR